MITGVGGAGSPRLTLCSYEKPSIWTTLHWESKTSHMMDHFFSSSSTVLATEGCYQVLQPPFITPNRGVFHPSSASSSSRATLPFSLLFFSAFVSIRVTQR